MDCKRNAIFGFLCCTVRTIFTDTLGGFKLLLRDDLQLLQQLRMGIPTADNACIGQVPNHSTDTYRMPAFPRPCTVAIIIQISCDMLRSIAFMHIFLCVACGKQNIPDTFKCFRVRLVGEAENNGIAADYQILFVGISISRRDVGCDLRKFIDHSITLPVCFNN